MASAAMRLLSDSDAKPEVRSEAARALGLMKINASVPKYNYALVAHWVGSLAADLATEIASLLPDSPKKATAKTARAPDEARKKAPAKAGPAGTKVTKGIAIPKPLGSPAEPEHPRSINPAKAKYLTALLVGPVYQAFSGVSGQGDSGLLRANTGENSDFVRKVFDLVTPVAKSAVDNLYSGSRQRDENKEELRGKVAALRDFLVQNKPADRHLVQDGNTYPLADAAGDQAVEDDAAKSKPAAAAAPRKGGRRPR